MNWWAGAYLSIGLTLATLQYAAIVQDWSPTPPDENDRRWRDLRNYMWRQTRTRAIVGTLIALYILTTIFAWPATLIRQAIINHRKQ